MSNTLVQGNDSPDELTVEQQRERDAYALACLIYDIWREKKIKDSEAKEVDDDQRE